MITKKSLKNVSKQLYNTLSKGDVNIKDIYDRLILHRINGNDYYIIKCTEKLAKSCDNRKVEKLTKELLKLSNLKETGVLLTLNKRFYEAHTNAISLNRTMDNCLIDGDHDTIDILEMAQDNCFSTCIDTLEKIETHAKFLYPSFC